MGAPQGPSEFGYLNTDVGPKDGAPLSPRKFLENKNSLEQRKVPV
jgi:hypothetical protein